VPDTRRGIRQGLLDRLALAITYFEEAQVVLHEFIGGILALSRDQRRVRALVVTTQHIREALVVENLDRRPDDTDRLTVGTVRQIKPAQPIVRGCQADPSVGIACLRLC
jgi:hypothetical protein